MHHHYPHFGTTVWRFLSLRWIIRIIESFAGVLLYGLSQAVPKGCSPLVFAPSVYGLGLLNGRNLPNNNTFSVRARE